MGKFSIRKSKKEVFVPPVWAYRQTYDDTMNYYFNTSRSATGVGVVDFEKPDELKTKEEKAKTSGDWCWVPHSTDVWQPGKLLKQTSNGTVLQPYGSTPITIPKNGVMEPCSETGGRRQEVPLWSVNHTTLNFLLDDLVKIPSLNEASLLYTIKERYMKDQIYSWVGASNQVLLSVNPYKKLSDNLYSDETKTFHKSCAHKPFKSVPAHAYAIANDSYDELLRTGVDQTILVSGESGAGKTETTKVLLDFFADKVGSHTVDHQVADKLLKCGPLLQAFGNAKTGLNDNSSRFGKFIRVSFNKDTNQIDGAEFVSFMLEQVRLINHGENERNFHVFYQLLADEECVSNFGLGKVKSYRYLNQSKKSLTPDPRDNLDDVRGAFSTIGFTRAEQQSVFKTLAGVLNLGNIEFKDHVLESNVTGSKIVDEAPLLNAADLLSVDVESLREVLTSHVFSARGEASQVALDAKGARDACDGLAKMIYEALFSTFLVRHLNQAMDPGHEDYFIGMLDIFGFEVLARNSLEQLLINYANEKLQQEMNTHSFDLEKELYSNEGIEHEFLQPIDHGPCIDLLEGRPNGLFTVLNDEVNLPRGSDKSWHGKVSKFHENNSLFLLDRDEQFKSTLSFQVSHYAAVVKYDCDGFVKKNADKVYSDATSLMAGSSDAVLSSIFKEKTKVTNTKPVCAKFKQNLGDLLGLIQKTSSRYIRCVKPNAKMASLTFDAPLVMKQLKFSGIYHTVDIRAGGFPYRLTHKAFAHQFACINIGHQYQNYDGSSQKWHNVCAEILNECAEDYSEDIKLGNSLVLYKPTVHQPLMQRRNVAIETFVGPKMQSFTRGCIARHYIHTMLVAERRLQKALDTANDIDMVREGFKLAEDVWDWLEPNHTYLPPYPMKRYDFGKILETRLLEWQDLEERMNEASSGKKPADVNVTLYKLLISYCEEADGILGDVKRTAAQQELYEFLQELIADSEPGKLDAEAGPALKSLDRARMQRASDKADDLGYSTETIDKIKHVLSRLEYIDEESRESLLVCDDARMKLVLDEAKQYKHTNEALEEIERMFTLPEKDFVKLELAAAKRLKDKPRAIHRRISLKEIFYDEEGKKYYDWTASGHLRSPTNYAAGAGMLCGKTGYIRGFMEWSDKPLPKPLTLMPGELEGSEDTKPIKKMKKDCKKMFVNLQTFMGDRKASAKKTEKCGQAFVNFGLENASLRNELYLQVIKQLTKNPSKGIDSIEKGWEMLSLCMSTFLPSDGFEHYLVMFIREKKEGVDAYRPYTSALHKLQFTEEDKLPKKPRALQEIKTDFDKLAIEGSRFSIAPGAFSGPTKQKQLNNQQPQSSGGVEARPEGAMSL